MSPCLCQGKKRSCTLEVPCIPTNVPQQRLSVELTDINISGRDQEPVAMEPAAREPLLAPAAAPASGTRVDARQQVQVAKDSFWPCVANLSKVIIGAGA